MNHPALADDAKFRAELLEAALNKPSNSDVYTVAMARFVDTFARVLGDPALPHLFFVEGGALAVENALKVAFDWKSRWNDAHGLDPALGTRVLHLREAFHGRSGYTMSLTNTDPVKVARYPKFDWPRIANPYVRAGTSPARARTRAGRARPGADGVRGAPARHRLRRSSSRSRARAATTTSGPSSCRRCRQLCHEHDALFVVDEVQTGCGLTGTAWALPAARAGAGRRRVRQEDPGLRHHGRRPGGRGARQRLRRRLADQLHLGRQPDRHGACPAHPGGRGGRRADSAGGGAGRAPARHAVRPGRRHPR